VTAAAPHRGDAHRPWLAWFAAVAFVWMMAGGPATSASGLPFFPTWAAGSIAGLAAIGVGRLARGSSNPDTSRVVLVLATGAGALVVVGAALGATIGRELAVELFGRGRTVLYGAGIVTVSSLAGLALGWHGGVADGRGRPFAGRPFAGRLLAGRSIVGDVLPIMALASFLLIDALELARGNPLRDLRLYLLAGQHFLDGVAVYRTEPLTALLDDPTLYPFLYPPPAIPIVALLAALPFPLVAGAWVLASLAALVAGLRALGVRWPWIPLLLAWPGVFVGLWVGNVAIPAFLFLALALRLPGLLVLGPLLKVQHVIPAVWLVRERRWTALAAGVGAVLLGALVTLPIVGVGAWFDWWAALRAFQASQAAFPGLYALALPRLLPYAAFLVVAAVAVGWALLGRGRDGLARLGLASVVASPSLYRHGFLTALPQVLRLDAALVWLVLGAGVTLNGLWLGLVVAAAASVLDLIRRRADDPLHPLGPDGLWPESGHPRGIGGVEGT
jgi:hypothetical protein